MINNTAAIVIPVYRSNPSELELVSLKQCFKVFSSYQIIIVKPKSLDLQNYNYDFNEVVSFDDMFFLDFKGYNKLMLSALFYERFLRYDYILIHQLDALAFKDDLLFWCNKGYDYIGAPWLRYAAYPDFIKEVKSRTYNYFHLRLNLKQTRTTLPTNVQFQNRVGNGGFSLRKTKKFVEICCQDQKMIEYYNSRHEHYFNEDAFWGLEVNRKEHRLKIPKYKEAVYFAIENSYKHAFQLTKGKVPFGCHAWDKHLSFWRPIFLENGIEV